MEVVALTCFVGGVEWCCIVAGGSNNLGRDVALEGTAGVTASEMHMVGARLWEVKAPCWLGKRSRKYQEKVDIEEEDGRPL
jgi:hypothetical protein